MSIRKGNSVIAGNPSIESVANVDLSNLSTTGKHYVAFKGYDSTTIYSLNDVVVSIQNNEVKLYKSLVNDNNYPLSDATKWEEVALGANVEIDGNTITLNSSDELQTVGVIDSSDSTTAIKLWTGTKEQYDAITTKDANTLYNITDDFVKKYEICNPFVFGESRYFEVAPQNASWLASNGQYNARSVYPDYYDWLNGKIGQVITANGGKVVLSTDTITDYDFVVNQNDQTFRLPLLNGERVLVKKYVNGSDWYNLYSDGWIEQGGYISSVPSDLSGVTVTFFKPFSNTDYFSLPAWGSVNYAGFAVGSRTTTGMSIFNRTNDATACFWKVCGYAPIPTQSDFTEVSGLYYYVGDTVQDASMINAGAVLGQLSDKISRTAASDKELVIGWGMPDWSAGVSLVVSSSSQTIVKKGWLRANSLTGINNTVYVLYINGIAFGIAGSTGTNNFGSVFIPVNVGDTYLVSPTSNVELSFYPCKGV